MLRFIRPHRSTTYVDAAYCHRPSSVVCRSVCHTSEPCKTELIEMPFLFRTRVGSGNHVLDGGSTFLHGKGNFEAGKGRPIVKYRDTLRSSVQKRLTDRDAVWVLGSNGPKESC